VKDRNKRREKEEKERGELVGDERVADGRSLAGVFLWVDVNVSTREQDKRGSKNLSACD